MLKARMAKKYFFIFRILARLGEGFRGVMTAGAFGTLEDLTTGAFGTRGLRTIQNVVTRLADASRDILNRSQSTFESGPCHDSIAPHEPRTIQNVARPAGTGGDDILNRAQFCVWRSHLRLKWYNSPMHELYHQADVLTQEVIDAAVKVQKHFGIGVLESIYVRCLERELQLAGHETSREGVVKISYRGLAFDENLRYDLLVDDCLLIEAKACEKENMDIWRMQLLTYLKLMDKPLGLVINFGNDHLPNRGLKRVILKGANETDEPF